MNNSVGSTSKIKKGAILSFIATAFEIIVNFFLLKYLTAQLGNEYGLYTLAVSIIGIFMADFGLSQSAMKFIAKYRIDDDKESENKLLGIFLKIYLILDAIIFTVAFVLFFFLQNIYSGLTADELSKFKVVYIIVAVYSCISFPLTPLNGILGAYEEFSLIKVLAILQKILSAVLLIVSLITRLGLYAVVLSNVFSALVFTFAKLYFVFRKCKIKPDIKANDRVMIKEIFAFTVWIAISSIASRLSLGMMSTVLAATQGSKSVAIFGVALTLETYVYTFSTVISGLFLPKITLLIESKQFDRINDLSIRVGKFQTLLSGLFLLGFVLFGKPFLNLYLEPMYIDSYLPTVCLLITVVISSSLVIPQTASYAFGTIKQVSLIELVVATIRLALCWLMAHLFGLNGMVLCYLSCDIIMHFIKTFFVFSKKQHLNFKEFLIRVYGKAMILFGVSLLIGWMLKRVNGIDSWASFFVSCVVFTAVYILISVFAYFDKSDRFSLVNEANKHAVTRKIMGLFNNRDINTGVPVILCAILIIFSLFSSDYPIPKIALASLLCFFVIAFFLYVYFVFPIKSPNKRDVFIYCVKSCGLVFAIVFCTSALLTLFLTKSTGSIFGIAKLCLFIVSSFLFTELFSFKVFARIFKKAFLIVCSISLILSATVIAVGHNFSPIYTNSSYFNYFYIFFTLNGARLWLRNTGMFWEPGVFASYCLFATFLTLVVDDSSCNRKIPYLITFIVCLISTGSLAGYLLIGLIIPFALQRLHDRSGWKVVSYIVVAFYLAGLVLFVPLYDFFSVLFPFIAGKGVSLTTRLYSFLVDMDVFMTSPLLGVGDKYQTLFTSVAAAKYPGLLDTSLNTFGFYIAYFGLIGFAFPILLFASIFQNKTWTLDCKLALALLVFLTFSKEPHTQSLISLVFVFYIIKEGRLFSGNRCVNYASYSVFANGIKNEK